MVAARKLKAAVRVEGLGAGGACALKNFAFGVDDSFVAGRAVQEIW